MCQSTTMCEHLQKNGLDKTGLPTSTLSAAAFPAKMFHAPVSEKVLRMMREMLHGPAYGESTQGSLANLSHAGLWEKMSEGCCQLLLMSDQGATSELFYGTWSTWGIMRFGHVTARKPWVRPTNEKESSLWPTAVASDGAQGAVIGKDDTFYTTSTGMPRKVNRNGTDGSVGLARLVQMWPTPRVGDVSGGDRTKWAAEGKWQTGLREAVNLQNWPTPNARDWKDTGDMQKLADNTHQITVPKAVAKLDVTQKGQLNADWVEILMGLPVGWTDITKDNDELTPWPGWPAPMNASRQWATPNCMDMLPSRSYEAMKRQATNGARKNRSLPGNLREQIDPLMRKAYVEASKENGGKLTEEMTVSGQYPYEPPRVTEGQKNRAKRLKCLGNGCCPEQIYPIFKLITEVENENRTL